MKALLTAFALLSFVAASTIPVVANAKSATEQTHSKKKKQTKKVSKKGSTHKKMAKPGSAA